MGPTASGKTGVAVDLVRELPCEIVSVDSAQVYRHMDVGTAKPDAATLKIAPHQLIDLIEPDDRYSAARFRDDALTAMREITERGNIPLLVGGTMMYFKTLLEGLSELPEADPAIRMVSTLWRRNRAGRPYTTSSRASIPRRPRGSANDSQRVQRALEVYYITNKPMSDLLKQAEIRLFSLYAGQARADARRSRRIHERIAARFEAMLEWA